MSKSGTEVTCFVIADKGAALDEIAAQLNEILAGKRAAPAEASYARWELAMAPAHTFPPITARFLSSSPDC